MNNTPTPRTDKAAYYMGREGEHRDSERWCDLLNESRDIERELIAAREEIEMMDIRYAAAEMHHANNMQEVIEQLTAARQELKAVTEQRDRLAEALNNLWYNHSLTGSSYELIEQALQFINKPTQ